MNQGLHSVEQVRAMISEGRTLMLAGDEANLADLPAGRWIGGTIPYFMAPEGGTHDRKRVFVTQVPAPLQLASVKVYREADISQVYLDIPPGGLALIVVPAESPTHLKFAVGAPSFERFAFRPLVGWISGVSLDDVATALPKVYSGESPTPLSDAAVVMHLSLPADAAAEVGIVNIFEPGDGAELTFPHDGLVAKVVHVDGEPRSFAQYIAQQQYDTRLPLVADYCGARINVSYRQVDHDNGLVQLYSPVFRGVSYRQARPIADYAAAFRERLAAHRDETFVFSCNCILNYLYAGLQGKSIGPHVGPITFGEIAYQLLNQTLVYLRLTGRSDQ